MSCHPKYIVRCKKNKKSCIRCSEHLNYVVPPKPVVSCDLIRKRNAPCPCANRCQECYVDANDLLVLNTSCCRFPFNGAVDDSVIHKNCFPSCLRKTYFDSPLANVKSSTYNLNSCELDHGINYRCQGEINLCQCSTRSTSNNQRKSAQRRNFGRNSNDVNQTSLRRPKTIERGYYHLPDYKVSSFQSKNDGTKSDDDTNYQIYDNCESSDCTINADRVSRYRSCTGKCNCDTRNGNQLHKHSVTEMPLGKSHSYHYCYPKEPYNMNNGYEAPRTADFCPHRRCKMYAHKAVGIHIDRSDKETTCNCHNAKNEGSSIQLVKKASDFNLGYDFFIPSTWKTTPFAHINKKSSCIKEESDCQNSQGRKTCSGVNISPADEHNYELNKNENCPSSSLECKCHRLEQDCQNNEKNITMSDFLHDLNKLPNDLILSISPCGNKQDVVTLENFSSSGSNLKCLDFYKCQQNSSNYSLNTCSKYVDKNEELGKKLVTNNNKNVTDVTIPIRGTHSIKINIRSSTPIQFCSNTPGVCNNKYSTNNLPNKITNSEHSVISNGCHLSLNRSCHQTDELCNCQRYTTENVNTNVSNLLQHEKMDSNLVIDIEKALLDISSQLTNIENSIQCIDKKKNILHESKSANTIISLAYCKRKSKYRNECNENCKYTLNSIPTELPVKLESPRKKVTQPKLASGTYIPPLFNVNKINNLNKNLQPVPENQCVNSTQHFKGKNEAILYAIQEPPGRMSLTKHNADDLYSGSSYANKILTPTKYTKTSSKFHVASDLKFAPNTNSDVELFDSVNAEKLNVIYNMPQPDFND